jgi:hypothetical protein
MGQKVRQRRGWWHTSQKMKVRANPLRRWCIDEKTRRGNDGDWWSVRPAPTLFSASRSREPGEIFHPRQPCQSCRWKEEDANEPVVPVSAARFPKHRSLQFARTGTPPAHGGISFFEHGPRQRLCGSGSLERHDSLFTAHQGHPEARLSVSALYGGACTTASSVCGGGSCESVHVIAATAPWTSLDCSVESTWDFSVLEHSMFSSSVSWPSLRSKRSESTRSYTDI